MLEHEQGREEEAGALNRRWTEAYTKGDVGSHVTRIER
jgi:hypothetical protein